jgi:hypothetical protein
MHGDYAKCMPNFGKKPQVREHMKDAGIDGRIIGK